MSTLLAYGLYPKLGYANVTYFPSAYKTVQYHGTSAYAHAHGKNAREELDLDTTLRIYNEFSRNRTGLAVRDKEYLETLLKTEGIKSRNCVVGEQGYVMFKRSGKGIQIKEIIAATMRELNKLVKEVESKARNAAYERARALLNRIVCVNFCSPSKHSCILLTLPRTNHGRLAEPNHDQTSLC